MASASTTGRKVTTIAAVAPHPITEEPRQERPHRTRSAIVNSAIGSEIEEASKLRGLSSLAVANSVQIKVDKRPWRCDWEVNYSVFDGETEAFIFNAQEDTNFCCNGILQTILIRDLGKNLVARVCYKENICTSKKLVMAVYAPVDLLVGTIEESTGYLGPIEYMIRDSDGRSLYHVEYTSGPCSIGSMCCCTGASCGGSNFTMKSCDTKAEVGRILEKTSKCLGFQFKTKLDITGKIILTGFCIGLIHKCYQINEEPTNS